MNRRTFLCGLTLGALAAPLAVEGQPGSVLRRIGVLTLSVAFSTPTFEAFRQGLRDQGYVEGQNITLELRFADGGPEKLAAMAADLVRNKVEVIVTESVLAAREARNATATIPIVTAIHGDPWAPAWRQVSPGRAVT
jgi:putative tryptophan/tyrosine transport system substrate-binding protein